MSANKTRRNPATGLPDGWTFSGRGVRHYPTEQQTRAWMASGKYPAGTAKGVLLWWERAGASSSRSPIRLSAEENSDGEWTWVRHDGSDSHQAHLRGTKAHTEAGAVGGAIRLMKSINEQAPPKADLDTLNNYVNAVQVGDILYSVPYSAYFEVVKLGKTGLKVRRLSDGAEGTKSVKTFHYLSPSDLRAARNAGGSTVADLKAVAPSIRASSPKMNPNKPVKRAAASRRNPHPSMSEQQASDTIAALGGMGKLRAMIGADNFIRGYETDGTPSLSFKFKGCKTANYARIALDPSDTYTLRLFKIRGYEAKPVYEASDLYAEQLRPAFERATGLYLSLGTMRGNPGKAARKAVRRPVTCKANRRNPHSIHPYVIFEEWRTTGFPKKCIPLLSAASGVDKKEMERHFGAKGYVYDPESEDDDILFSEVENGIVDRYGMPTAAEYAESRAALRAGGTKAPARSSIKKAPKPKAVLPLSAFKHHPYLDFSSWEGSDYKDQSYLKAISMASGVPLKTLREGKFGYGAKDDALAARIEGVIVDRYGSPWTDNPRKPRARRVAR